ncbi:MAG: tail fiber domain-containing protein [Rhodospirillaceae bacterium]|nr:tail fiber domain-containing protein [Rhodospirillaceae bacterium]
MLAAILVLTTTRAAHAAEYSHGDSCSEAGALHRKNDAGGFTYLICDGANWKYAIEYGAAGNNLRLDDDPSGGDAGCFKYDGTGGHIQFAHDCSTFVDLNTVDSFTGGPPTYLSLEQLQNVDTSGKSNNDVLTWNGSGWIAQAGGGGGGALDDLSDVDTTGYANGNVLMYSAGASGWVPGMVGGGGGTSAVIAPAMRAEQPNMPLAPDGNDWADAIVCTGSTGRQHTLMLFAYDDVGSGNNQVHYLHENFDGGVYMMVWYNKITGVRGSTGGTVGNFHGNDCSANYVDNTKIYFGGGSSGGGGGALDDLSDVNTSGFADGNILMYSGGASAWVPGTVSASTPPAGSGRELQFNSSGSFSADSNLVYTATGYLGIGTNNPDATLDIAGDIEFTGTITDVSDRRLKDNIAPLPGALGGINALEAVSFTMKDDVTGRTEYGFIAQDVEPLFPDLVQTKQDGVKTLNYLGMIAPLVKATQEQQDIIDRQAEAIADLQARIEALEAEGGGAR